MVSDLEAFHEGDDMEMSNREIAWAIWLAGLALTLTIRSPNIRGAFIRLIRASLHWKIIVFVFSLLGYFTAMIWFLAEVGLWEFSNLKVSLLWFVGVGVIALNKLATSHTDPHKYFKDSIIQSLGFVAVLEIFLGMATFPLWAEFLIVVISTCLAALMVVAKSNPETKPAGLVLEWILGLFALVLASFSLYSLWGGLSESQIRGAAEDFYIPPLLTLLSIPFFYGTWVFFLYNRVYVWIRIAAARWLVRTIALVVVFCVFNVRTSMLDRWKHCIPPGSLNNLRDLLQSLRRAYKMKLVDTPSNERSSEGWGVYESRRFLSHRNLQTGVYRRDTNGWAACSANLVVGEGKHGENSVEYFIFGDEQLVRQLKLVLNVFDPSIVEPARARFVSETEHLLSTALSTEAFELPHELERSIESESELTMQVDGLTVEVIRRAWCNHSFGGYDLSIVLSKRV